MEKELQSIKENIRRAAAKAGRKEEEILLLGVSKTKPYTMLREAYQCGIRDFGENKVQEIREKYEGMTEDPLMQEDRPHFHMIGNLQKNKVKYLPGKVCLIHSVDSVSLAESIEKEYGKKGETARILLEVNVAKEESKSGFMPESLEEAVSAIETFSHIEVTGLMTVAPFTEDPEENRPVFRALRVKLQELQKNFPALPLKELSMGMSGDYTVAAWLSENEPPFSGLKPSDSAIWRRQSRYSEAIPAKPPSCPTRSEDKPVCCSVFWWTRGTCA